MKNDRIIVFFINDTILYSIRIIGIMSHLNCTSNKIFTMNRIFSISLFEIVLVLLYRARNSGISVIRLNCDEIWHLWSNLKHVFSLFNIRESSSADFVYLIIIYALNTIPCNFRINQTVLSNISLIYVFSEMHFLAIKIPIEIENYI